MIRRIRYENINTPEYIDQVYKNLDWSAEHGQTHLFAETKILTDKYQKHLDIGCCDGLFTKYYLERFPDTEGYGIDHSSVAIEKAKELCPTGTFISGDLYSLPFENDFFDLVHSAQTIEHLERPEIAIKEMLRVLKPHGIFVITTTNEFASDYEEHVWKWNINGVKKIIPGKWKSKREFRKFFNGHMLYIMGEKL